MGLRRRYFIVILAVCVVTTTGALVAFSRVVSRVTENLGSAYARQYSLANRSLLQEPLAREIALARQLADSPIIRAWARIESSAEARRGAFAELESYRGRFTDRTWFYIVNRSLHYYFDDGKHTYGDGHLAYTLGRAADKDAWYFATLDQVQDYALNVNYDAVIDTVKVWINVVVREPDGTPLGMAGTGIDLSEFLHTFIDRTETGVENIVLDSRLAIQAYRDRGLIDMHSLTKAESERSTVARLIDKPEDLRLLTESLLRIKEGGTPQPLSIAMGGKRKILGATYLAVLDWYVLTALDLDQLIGKELFVPIAILGIAVVLFIAGMVAWSVNRMVLTPLAVMTGAAQRISEGDYRPPPEMKRFDEIGTLARAFSLMAAAVQSTTAQLEARVHERTIALDESNRKLAELNRALEDAATTDIQTGLLNRRGMLAILEKEIDRLNRGISTMSLLLIDLDFFKRINDTHGHEAGDRVLSEVARAIKGSVRSYDHCARWGGEEFLISAPGGSRDDALILAEKLRTIIASTSIRLRDGTLSVTASVGACVVNPAESLDASLIRVDTALYRAKSAGRNRSVLAES
jgi:diguanylate cyclase (GGDEF)-like protein